MLKVDKFKLENKQLKMPSAFSISCQPLNLGCWACLSSEVCEQALSLSEERKMLANEFV